MGQQRLLEIAAASRESYLTHYAAVVKRERAEHDHVVAKLLIELGGPTSGMLQKLWRLDVVWGGQSDFHVVEANDRPVVIGAPLLTLPGPPSLEVFPFVWNGCEFIWPSAVQLDDDFEAWYRKWMDLEDAKPANDGGLSGVIHSVTASGSPIWGLGGVGGFRLRTARLVPGVPPVALAAGSWADTDWVLRLCRGAARGSRTRG